MSSFGVLLLATALASGFPLKAGPSIRYLLSWRNAVEESGSVLYEQSVSDILFNDEALVLLGVRVDVPFHCSYGAILEGYWQEYEPSVVCADSAQQFSIDRTGNIAIYSAGLRRNMGSWSAVLLVEGIHFSESWSNPSTGVAEHFDSLAVGPGFLGQADIDVNPGALVFGMGVSFPAFSDVFGRISLSYLLP